MKPKILLTVTTVIMTLHALGLFFGASGAAQMGFGETNPLSPDALNMGQGAYELAGVVNLFLAVVLISARKFEGEALRSIAKGIAVGWVLMTATVVYHVNSLIEGQAPPTPAIGIFGVITAWALYVAFGTKDEVA